MTYNTKIYNYKNLHTEDKQIVQAQLLMFETIEDLITEYTYSKEACTNTLEIISYEEGIKALEDAKEKMLPKGLVYSYLDYYNKDDIAHVVEVKKNGCEQIKLY